MPTKTNEDERVISIKIPRELWRELKVLCAKKETTITARLTKLIKDDTTKHLTDQERT